MKNIGSIIKTGAILLVIGFVCTLILTVCNYVTKDRIKMLSFQAEQDALTETLPEADKFVKMSYESDGIITAVYEAKAEDKSVVGYCVKAEPVGYGGAISMIVGVDVNGAVTGVKIISMSETAGLGANASKPEFTNGFVGKTADIKVNKKGAPGENEIAAISGATVTSKAVTEGVNAAIAAVDSLK